MSTPTVSVVIPTRGGELVDRAVESALQQTGVLVEVIVAANGVTAELNFTDNRVRVIHTPAEDGANGARQAGIDLASADFIALLDDDDHWRIDKLSLQLAEMKRREAIGGNWVVGCQLLEVRSNGQETLAPRSAHGEIASASEYLFQRTALRSNRPQLQTSTILFRRSLGETVRFDARRKFHQDWTWVLDAERAGVEFAVVSQPLSFRVVQSSGSISGKITWQQTLAWGSDFLPDPRTFGDFALTMAAAKAARTRDLPGLIHCFRSATTRGRPGISSLVFWASLFFRTGISRLLNRRKRTDNS